MKRAMGAACLLFAGACGYCARPLSEPPRDAGALTQSAAEPSVVDLRGALLTLVPEFRFLSDFEAEAVLEQTLVGWPDAGSGGFTPLDAGLNWASATRPPFHLHLQQEGENTRLRLRLPLSAEDLVKLLQATAPLTSRELGAMVPSKGAGILDERFNVAVRYQAKPEHIEPLLGQVVGAWLKAGFALDARASTWEPTFNDRGVLDVPERFHVDFTSPEGARVWAEREGSGARLSLTQVLRKPSGR